MSNVSAPVQNKSNGAVANAVQALKDSILKAEMGGIEGPASKGEARALLSEIKNDENLRQNFSNFLTVLGLSANSWRQWAAVFCALRSEYNFENAVMVFEKKAPALKAQMRF